MTRRLATIDLGTNTVRVLVVEANGLDWRALHQAQRVTRLGEGQAAAGRLLDGPMRRTAEAVTAFVAAAEENGATEVLVVATSAVREAPDRDEFVALARAMTGMGRGTLLLDPADPFRAGSASESRLLGTRTRFFDTGTRRVLS